MFSERGETDVLDKFPIRLREARETANLTQAQVAKRISINRTAISSYETGSRRPSYEVLVRLATLYRTSADYLLGISAERPLDTSGLTAEEWLLVKDFVQIIRSVHH